MKTKICIIISGGNLQEIYSNQEIEVEILDFDNLNLSTREQDEMIIEKTAEYNYVQ